MKSKSEIKIFVIAPFADSNWRWLEHWFDRDKYEWNFFKVDLLGTSHRKIWWWLYYSYKAAIRVKEDDLVITIGPWMALYVSIAMTILKKKNKILACTFNHGNGKYFTGVYLFLARKIMLKKINLYVTYSQEERKIYSKKYKIPLDRIAFTHWAVSMPDKIESYHPLLKEGEPYICTIGRNNRDLDTFIESVNDLEIKIIIVCRKAQLDLKKIRNRHITVFENISLKECNQILSNALINIVPIKDASVGAGHMTIVKAMQYGVPQIITDISTIRDYFIHNQHGLLVKSGNSNDMRKSILKLISNKELRKYYSANSIEFSKKWLSEEAAYKSLKATIDSIVTEKTPSLNPLGWSSADPHIGFSPAPQQQENDPTHHTPTTFPPEQHKN